MKRLDVAALGFGTVGAYILLLAFWGVLRGAPASWEWVGFWHPALMALLGAFDGLVVCCSGGIELPRKRLPPSPSLDEVRALKAELDALKIAITDKELGQ